MTSRAAFYVRVSTDDQTCANQVLALRQFADARGLVLFQHFEESASAMGERAQLRACLESAHRGEFDVLIVWALDRLGRRMADVVDVVRKLDDAGVRLYSVRESWLDMSGPTRGLLLAIFGWVAEQERARLVERTHAGLARARAEGKKLGRPKARIDPRALELAMRELKVPRKVARRLGVSRATIYRELASQKRSQKNGA